MVRILIGPHTFIRDIVEFRLVVDKNTTLTSFSTRATASLRSVPFGATILTGFDDMIKNIDRVYYNYCTASCFSLLFCCCCCCNVDDDDDEDEGEKKKEQKKYYGAKFQKQREQRGVTSEFCWPAHDQQRSVYGL